MGNLRGRRTVIVLVVMVLVSACGASGTSTAAASTIDGRTTTSTTTAAPEATTTTNNTTSSNPDESPAATSSPEPDLTYAEFTADSGNIACYMTPEVVSCWISEKIWEIDQPEDCGDQDFGNAIDLSNGEVSWPCYTDFAWNPFADPLAPEESISIAPHRCTATPSGVTCDDTLGGVFELSHAPGRPREPPVVAPPTPAHRARRAQRATHRP